MTANIIWCGLRNIENGSCLEIFEEVSATHNFKIHTLEIAKDNVYIFLSFPPWYSISKVARILKSISPSVIFKEHHEVKKES